jgi:hypothetical protein
MLHEWILQSILFVSFAEFFDKIQMVFQSGGYSTPSCCASPQVMTEVSKPAFDDVLEINFCVCSLYSSLEVCHPVQMHVLHVHLGRSWC